MFFISDSRDVTEEVHHILQVHRFELNANGEVPWSINKRLSYSADRGRTIRVLAPRSPFLGWPPRFKGRLGTIALGKFGRSCTRPHAQVSYRRTPR
jgi:hypothetical protein